MPFSKPGAEGRVDHPNALLKLGGVILFIYPQQSPEYLQQQWDSPVNMSSTLVSPRGHVIDHFAIRYPDVRAEVARLKKMNVKILEDVHNFGNSTMRAAMIEGPDSIAIELVEGPRVGGSQQH